MSSVLFGSLILSIASAVDFDIQLAVFSDDPALLNTYGYWQNGQNYWEEVGNAFNQEMQADYYSDGISFFLAQTDVTLALLVDLGTYTWYSSSTQTYNNIKAQFNDFGPESIQTAL